MEYFPVYLDLRGKKALVVGGGGVALRKVGKLLDSGAYVTLVSPEITDGFKKFAENPFLEIIEKEFEEKDFKQFDIIFSNTDKREVNSKIAGFARENKILCNIADSIDESDFIVPSKIQRGDLTLTISTNGKSPALSRKIRQDLEFEFGEEYELFLNLLGSARAEIVNENRGAPENKEIFRKLVFGKTLQLLREKDIKGLKKELAEILGNDLKAEGLVKKTNITENKDLH